MSSSSLIMVPSGVIALSSQKFTIFVGVQSSYLDHNFIKLGHILSTIMSFSSLLMVNMAPCLQESLPFVHKIFIIFDGVQSVSPVILSQLYETWSHFEYHNVFFKFDNGLYGTKPLGVIALWS